MQRPLTTSRSSSGSSSTIQSLTSASTLDTKLDFSPTAEDAPGGGLRPSLFSPWRDDASTVNLVDDSPEELQKKDPLGIQIWRLYSKTKNALPNQERMDNLSWRMMSMNLKKQQEEHFR
jgi:GATA-binding protein